MELPLHIRAIAYMLSRVKKQPLGGIADQKNTSSEHWQQNFRCFCRKKTPGSERHGERRRYDVTWVERKKNSWTIGTCSWSTSIYKDMIGNISLDSGQPRQRHHISVLLLANYLRWQVPGGGISHLGPYRAQRSTAPAALS